MAEASLTKVLACTKDQLKKVIMDYEHYPQHLEGIDKASIVADKGKSKDVLFQLNLIKTFTYTLRLTETDEGVSWVLVEGDLFKKNDGSWKLKPVEGGKKVEATYSLNLDFKMFVPGMVTKKLAGSQLPSMMQEFERWAQGST